MTDAPEYGLSLLKEVDPERYLACLYLPAHIRNDIATLWAFDAEIARIPNLVSEPMPGEIRLQWWRDLIKSGGNGGSGPLADGLLSVIGKHNLPAETIHTYLEARIFDLYNDPMPDTGTFEGYLGETVSVHFQNAALCSGMERSTQLADVCGHAGMVIGIARLLAGLSRDRSKQKLFFPLDMLEKHSLDAQSWFSEEIYEEHLLVVGELCRVAKYHHTFASTLLQQLPQMAKPVFLQLALMPPLLKKIEKAGSSLFSRRTELSPLQRHWHLFRGATG